MTWRTNRVQLQVMGPTELVLIVVWLIVAGLAGFAASILTRSRYRFILDTGVALVGAVVGGLVITGLAPGGVSPLSGGGVLIAMVGGLVSATALKLVLKAVAPHWPPEGVFEAPQGQKAEDLPPPRQSSPLQRPADTVEIEPGTPGRGPLPRASLRRLLEEYLSLEEGRTLAFDLDVSYDSLPGEGHAAKMRELIKYLDQRGQLARVVDWLRMNRSDIDLAGAVET